jgi:hypothetical protein
MSRVTKPVPISLDAEHERMLNVLLQEQKQWKSNRSALMRRLIAREFRSHEARKRYASRKAQPPGEPHEQ